MRLHTATTTDNYDYHAALPSHESSVPAAADDVLRERMDADCDFLSYPYRRQCTARSPNADDDFFTALYRIWPLKLF